MSAVEHWHKGAIAWMARNAVASNLVMVVIFLGGLSGLSRIAVEIFPEFDLDTVQIVIPYPGASPTEVEQGVVLAVEEVVRGLNGIKRVTSLANEGQGLVVAELMLGENKDRVLNDIKSAVDRITTLPQDSEKPVISIMTPNTEIISLVISGDLPLREIHALAEDARQALLRSSEITQIAVRGTSPLEISVEIPNDTLEAYGLTLPEVAAQIATASVELPAGSIETRSGDILVRVADRKRDAPAFENIILRGTREGAAVRLGDIATIIDGFSDTHLSYSYDGKPAVRLTAYRVGDESPIRIAEVVRAYAATLQASLPGHMKASIWRDRSLVLDSRIDLLLRNARSGFVLVLLTLGLFLRMKLAGWIALGIPTSFLGAFCFMPIFGISINMITLFALIITLGLVVDDAIVVGENVYKKLEQGFPPLQAAIQGAQEMAVPVIFSVLTTVAAFMPLLTMPGVLGKFFSLIPVIVIGVLLISLFECLFVLPAHLAHGSNIRGEAKYANPSWIEKVQNGVNDALIRFSNNQYKRLLASTLKNRYLVLAGSLSVFIVVMGAIATGYVPFNFFPQLEGDVVSVTARMPYGHPVERTQEVQRIIEKGLREAITEMHAEKSVVGTFSRIGEGGSGGNAADSISGGHVADIEVNLVSSDERTFGAADLAKVWSKKIPPIPGIQALTVKHASGPGAGAAVNIQLSHPNVELLGEAAETLTEKLRAFSGLYNIDNSHASGRPQLDFHINQEARSLGLTSSDIAKQVRGALYGSLALRDQRGRNEVRVMTRLPQEERRDEYLLDNFLLRTPDGTRVPISQAVTIKRGVSPTTIKREESQRIINVSGELRPGVGSSKPILDVVRAEILPQLKTRYPGIEADVVGAQREQGETFVSLKQSGLLALFIIYALLAIPFKNYIQPFIIMTAIPMGFVGAVLGHVLMGFSLTIISVFGIIALSGVVVNDSLVLVHGTNELRTAGISPTHAVTEGAISRIRPILLTSFTTFFGLFPMIFETSVQARFLIPMAISLGFGVMFATLVTLLVVPALYVSVEDLREWRTARFG